MSARTRHEMNPRRCASPRRATVTACVGAYNPVSSKYSCCACIVFQEPSKPLSSDNLPSAAPAGNWKTAGDFPSLDAGALRGSSGDIGDAHREVEDFIRNL